MKLFVTFSKCNKKSFRWYDCGLCNQHNNNVNLAIFIFSAKASKLVGSWQLRANFTGNYCFYVSHETVNVFVSMLSVLSVSRYIEFRIRKTWLGLALIDNKKIIFFSNQFICIFKFVTYSVDLVMMKILDAIYAS